MLLRITIQIFLSMIPNWLISNDKIKSEIIRLHSKNTNIEKTLQIL